MGVRIQCYGAGTKQMAVPNLYSVTNLDETQEPSERSKTLLRKNITFSLKFDVLINTSAIITALTIRTKRSVVIIETYYGSYPYRGRLPWSWYVVTLEDDLETLWRHAHRSVQNFLDQQLRSHSLVLKCAGVRKREVLHRDGVCVAYVIEVDAKQAASWKLD